MRIGELKPRDFNRVVSEVTAVALFMVYFSRGDMPKSFLVDKINQETDFEEAGIDKVMNALFDQTSPFLRHSEEYGGTIFATHGYWLLESAYMHGDETIDGLNVVEANLATLGVLKKLQSLTE